MITRLRLLRFALFSLIFSWFFAQVPVVAERKITRRRVAPGCVYVTLLDVERELALYALNVDLHMPFLSVRPALSEGYPSEGESVLSMARRMGRPGGLHVVGGVNGDYFSAGRPSGLYVASGRVIKSGRGWSALAIASGGRLRIDRFRLQRGLTQEDRPVSQFEGLDIQQCLQPAVPGVQHVLSGGPRLLRSGFISVEREQEGQGKGFDTERHPRTAAGLSRDGRFLVLMVVDGRQPGYSRGIDLFELASLLKEFGCFEALNLDGGGSTTLVIDNAVSNRPSDLIGPRAVANGLFVVYSGFWDWN